MLYWKKHFRRARKGWLSVNNRKWMRLTALGLTVLTLFFGATALAVDTVSDPLISRSYLQTVFSAPVGEYLDTARQMLDNSLQSKLEGLWSASSDYAAQKAAREMASGLTAQVSQRAQALLSAQRGGTVREGMRQVSLKKGDVITGTPGGSMIFLSGAGQIAGPSGAEVLNVTAGSTRAPGLAIKTGILYMILADDGSGIRVTSDTALVLVRDGARAGQEAQYTLYADALKQLGLFKGTGVGYELERAPTRQEALVMLIRLLGEEQDALACAAETPFRDPPTWADGKKYIAYGYTMGYTNGTSASTFSPTANSALEQYLTFVLRALGYRDGEDFVWNTTSRELAVQLGLVSRGELDAIGQTGFLRDHVVLISYRALSVRLKDSSVTLAERLMARDVITRAQLDEARKITP